MAKKKETIEEPTETSWLPEFDLAEKAADPWVPEQDK